MDELRLPSSLLEEMIAQAEAQYPEEACGLISGRDGVADSLYPVENIHHSPVAYEMEPLGQVRAMLAIEAGGLDLLAIYHSHPDGPARPSATDVALAYYPDSAYVIISLADRERPSVRAFMIQEGQVTEIAVARIS
jgi:proteasome lid subunit RPN8/RPN11